MKKVGDYWLPDAEEHLVPAYEAGGFQLDHLERALAHVTSFRTAIDGGAHAGSWTRALAKRFQLTVAFEPHPDTYACLTKNVRQPSVWPVMLALSDQQAEWGMDMDDRWKGNTGGSYLTSGRFVQSIALDNLFFREIDFIKLDVEGHEAKALQGAEAMIKHSRPVILFEHKRRLAARYGHPDAAIHLLRRWGYSEVDRVGNDLIYKFT